jgi:DNA-directed RNA polymerase specialized sigma24 family protein
MMTAREQQQIASEYLFRYRTAKAEVKDIEQRIDRVRSEMMGVKGISYEGGDMPKTHNTEHDLSDYIARIDGLLHDWQDAQNRALDVMREVSDTINSISNAQARRVLMLYYVDGKKYPEIQKIIPCGNNACFKWRRIGLMEIYSKLGSLG